MSAIANFSLIEKSRLQELKEASAIIIKKGFLKNTHIDNYPAYIQINTQSLPNYDGSGYIFATLFIYLLEEKEIDLLDNEYSELATELSANRENTILIFTKEQSDRYSSQLNPDVYDANELNAFNLAFSEIDDPDFGVFAIKAISSLKGNLEAIPNNESLLLLEIS